MISYRQVQIAVFDHLKHGRSILEVLCSVAAAMREPARAAWAFLLGLGVIQLPEASGLFQPPFRTQERPVRQRGSRYKLPRKSNSGLLVAKVSLRFCVRVYPSGSARSCSEAQRDDSVVGMIVLRVAIDNVIDCPKQVSPFGTKNPRDNERFQKPIAAVQSNNRALVPE